MEQPGGLLHVDYLCRNPPSPKPAPPEAVFEFRTLRGAWLRTQGGPCLLMYHCGMPSCQGTSGSGGLAPAEGRKPDARTCTSARLRSPLHDIVQMHIAASGPAVDGAAAETGLARRRGAVGPATRGIEPAGLPLVASATYMWLLVVYIVGD